MDDDAILTLVRRLARPHASGGAVIERAAILADGSDFASVIAWIAEHDGEPEAGLAPVSTHGLHGSRLGFNGRFGFPQHRVSLSVGRRSPI